MAAPEKVFEVNKDMDLTSIMQLVDLNGTMVNFQSDFTITSPGEISVAIVNQHQLDNGEIHFEKVSGSYSRRITYQENVHQNHFLALKSNPPVTCHITIRLKELPLNAVRRKTHERDIDTDERRVRFQDDATTPRDMGRDMRTDAPRDMGRDMGRDTPTPRASMPSTLEPSVKQELHDQLEQLYQKEDYADNPTPDDKTPPPKHHNPYYFVGIICITLFVLMMSYKFLIKK